MTKTSDIIKLPRSTLTEDLWRNGNLARMFIYLLSKADDSISIRSAAKDTGLTVREVRTAFDKLKKTGAITQVATQKTTQKTTQVATQISLCVVGGKAKPATQVATQVATQKTTQAKASAFVPPTQEEVTRHCLANGYHFNPEQFIPYYEKQGWEQSNGLPLKDWKAACRYWETRWKEKYGEQFYYQKGGQSGAAKSQNRYDSLRAATAAVLQQPGNIDAMYDDYVRHT